MRLSNSALIKDAVEHGADIEIYKTGEGDWIGRVCYGESSDGLSYAYSGEWSEAAGVLVQLLGILNAED